MGRSDAVLSLTLVNDRTMARLNRETFGRRGPTNVIAFPVDGGEVGGPGAQASRLCDTPVSSPEGPSPVSQPTGRGTAGRTPESTAPPPILGEVVISLETTRRQARENGWPWEQLFDFFLIHGILHLLGYDHAVPADEDCMTARTWDLLRLLHPGIEL